MTATKNKKRAKEPAQSINDLEHIKETVLTPKLKAGQVYQGYIYKQPVSILIKFEQADHTRSIKMMNRDAITFTRIVNDALKAHLKANKF